MNQSIGKFFSYFLPIIVILVIYIVISRYVFGVGRADLQELALYLHALVFLGCAGWALAEEEHVRVDILYKDKSKSGSFCSGCMNIALYSICIALV